MVWMLGLILSKAAVAKEARSYAPIRARIEKVQGLEKTVLGYVGEEKLPVYALFSPAKPNDQRLNVLLSAGVHGDEPAGVHTVLEFLETKAPAYADRFRFFVFPCVNPVGFERDTINSGENLNVNRMFKTDTPSTEAKLVKAQLEKWNVKFAFTIDMHEIPPYWADEGFTAKDNPREAYLYETHADKTKRIGRKLLDELPKEIEVCRWPKIYGDKADRGLVSYPEGNFNPVYAEQTTLDGFLQANYSPHTFTSETPIGWPLAKRVRAQTSWLLSALKHYSKGN